MKKLLHTPEGVRDIYNSEAEKKLKLQDNLHNVLKKYGYHSIQTPSFEFLDVFNHEVGTIPSKDLFKFFDRDGNTLVLRPDITPSIARAASKYFMNEEVPIRLSYIGNTFTNNLSYQGRLKESTQLGAELINDDSVDADAEIIALVIELLKTAGLKEFTVSIGQTDFFKSILSDVSLDESTEETLREYITNKNVFGVEELLITHNIPDEIKEIFLEIVRLFGSIDVIEKAKKLTLNKKAVAALERLEEIYEVLTYYGLEEYVSFDLGMLSSYQYYTGVVFGAFTYGTGDVIVKGGRYDNLLSRFGKDAPAIGFAVVVDQLMNALSRQKIEISYEKNTKWLLFEKASRKPAIELASKLRSQDINIELICITDSNNVETLKTRAKYHDVTEIVFIDKNGNQNQILISE